METLKSEIAANAARLVVEEGLDYGAAKRRAVRQLGLPPRSALPDNEAMEQAIEEYIDLFCADTQPRELHALREVALTWMERMADFRPHLSGPVWLGSATRLSDVLIQLFCDDCKSAEISLINHGVEYEPRTVNGMHGDPVEALTVAAPCRALGGVVGVHLLVYDLDDLRGALRPDSRGRLPRGNLDAVRRLVMQATEPGSIRTANGAGG